MRAANRAYHQADAPEISDVTDAQGGFVLEGVPAGTPAYLVADESAEYWGTIMGVDVPSGEVKLNREFDITSNSPMTMLIDFDGNQSIHPTGNGRYMMSPVVTVLSVN